jgi:hypothetical protein
MRNLAIPQSDLSPPLVVSAPAPVSDTVEVMNLAPGTNTEPEPESNSDDTADSSWVLIGLDGEMSSADLSSGGRLIQAGFAAWSTQPGGDIETFTSLIRQTEMDWSARAATVHNIARESVEAGPPPEEVDEAAFSWLLAHGAVEGRRLVVPIGLNVGSFDMPFFRQALPRTASLISRRSVDLNALCFTFADWDPNHRASSARNFTGWKRSMKTAVNAELARRGFAVAEHDAGYDAAQALLGWWWLRRQMTDLTAEVARLDGRLDAADPLRATLGDGLLMRLERTPRSVLEQIVASLTPNVSPRRWFGTPSARLGATPLQALLDGRDDEVIAASST